MPAIQSVMRQMTGLPRAHLAAKAALPPKRVTTTAQDTVATLMACWASEKSHLPLDRRVAHAIDKHLRTLPIVHNAA